MDKIFSTRIDEAIIQRISNLARHMKTSKKQVIEQAIHLLSERIDKDKNTDIFMQTFGIWKRKESANQIVKKVRTKFDKSMRRHNA